MESKNEMSGNVILYSRRKEIGCLAEEVGSLLAKYIIAGVRMRVCLFRTLYSLNIGWFSILIAPTLSKPTMDELMAESDFCKMFVIILKFII